ncbi:maleylpyruvate isomerase family mycothiol-dependent enzyme [Nocardiopsis sp. EMB25]|uniref:maleylpyruvate isomerase family mycothiol-dependent enzyme n=1 Tax=Nocardiopsis sp. EMB25 TaxID=2835867 RepID=UPI002283C312|nr:maleylpyruvate isomerase family mycothiol-dependent enzyme [Nocardiopsis sp. EMB25]MCY9783981.1 maleylpyruvate isomerase family mycothiol-dependent enzyme [Nocardiopsis sp. EMB25]
MDSASVYTSCQDRLFDLAAELTADQLATDVPALPAWDVRQTYAHLAGISVDVAYKGLTPPSDDEATARQVAERAEDDLPVICAEWRAATPALLKVLARETRARYALPALDVWHHENDLRGALGMAPQTDYADQLADFVLRGLGRGWDESLPGVRVVATDTGQEWRLGGGDDLELRASAFELARAATGRRSIAQITAMDWSGDPSAVAARLPTLPAPERDLDL